MVFHNSNSIAMALPAMSILSQYSFLATIVTPTILCFKVTQVDFPNKCVLQSLNIAFIIANSADPGVMQQTTKLPFQGFPVYKGLFPIIRRVQTSNAPWSETTRPRALILCL